MNDLNLSEAVVSALMQGRKIDAIKILREEENLGLKEANDRVNRYIQQAPALQEQFANSGKGGFSSLIVLAVVIGLIYYIVSSL